MKELILISVWELVDSLYIAWDRPEVGAHIKPHTNIVGPANFKCFEGSRHINKIKGTLFDILPGEEFYI